MLFELWTCLGNRRRVCQLSVYNANLYYCSGLSVIYLKSAERLLHVWHVFIACFDKLTTVGQSLLALRVWPGLILTVSHWIKTESGTALYLTPSPQTTLETRCHSKCRRSYPHEKLLCEYLCLPVCVCPCLKQSSFTVHQGGKVVVSFLFFFWLWILSPTWQFGVFPQKTDIDSLLLLQPEVFLLQ